MRFLLQKKIGRHYFSAYSYIYVEELIAKLTAKIFTGTSNTPT
jgi:hypothetical protein